MVKRPGEFGLSFICSYLDHIGMKLLLLLPRPDAKISGREASHPVPVFYFDLLRAGCGFPDIFLAGFPNLTHTTALPDALAGGGASCISQKSIVIMPLVFPEKAPVHSQES